MLPISCIHLIGDEQALPGMANGTLRFMCTEACQCQYNVYSLQSREGLFWFRQNNSDVKNEYPAGVTEVTCHSNWLVTEIKCHIEGSDTKEVMFDPFGNNQCTFPLVSSGNGWWILQFDGAGLNFTKLNPCLRYNATQKHTVDVFTVNWNYMTVSEGKVSIAYYM